MDQIIEFIDKFLERTGKTSINAVEANSLLEKAGILKDNKIRPGKPLRDLLRKGRLPHAYQSSGKGSGWSIPHSGKTSNTQVKTGEPKKAELEKLKLKTNNKVDDFLVLKHKLNQARLKYKPSRVKTLLIAEAAPDSIDRFFYYTDVRKHDYLFLGVAEVLYPDLKEKYLESGRDKEIKNDILRKFQNDGFYLLDLSELPLSYLHSSLEEQLPQLIKNIRQVVENDTRIILIKANVYDIAYTKLKDQFRVINKRIPFPGQGGQLKFRKEFKEALSLLGPVG